MKQTQTILFLTRLYHPHIGGVEKHVQILSRQLIEKGYSITILTEQFDRRLPLEEVRDGVRIIRIPLSKSQFLKKFSIWKWMALHVSLIVTSDIVHVHDVFYWIFPIWPIVFYKKIYMTFHGYEGYPVKMRWILQRKVSELLSRGSICVGDFMKTWYYARPTKVMYGGVIPFENEAIPKEQSAVFFGRLDAQTGILEYIEAYKLLKKRFPRFQLTVVGEGELKKHVPKDVKKVPFDSDVQKYIAKNRFIFVSRYLSMLEALIQKREIIAVYDTPIKRDYLAMSPFKNYVHIAKNGQEVADIVANRLNGEREGMVTKGYAWAKKQSWKKVTHDYLELWGEI